MAQLTTVLKIDGLKKFLSDVRSGKSPAIVKTLKQWGVRYRSFVQQRFDQFSKGGGDWPPLAESTIRGRRKSNANPGGSIAILRDTNTMFQALSPVFQNQPGAFEETKPEDFSIIVGFGGAAKHPKGKATIADIARFHNFGMGFNPERKIIVVPDSGTALEMAGDAERNLNAEAKREIG